MLSTFAMCMFPPSIWKFSVVYKAVNCPAYGLPPDNPQLRTRCFIPIQCKKTTVIMSRSCLPCAYLFTFQEYNAVYHEISISPHNRAIQTPAAR